MGGHDVRLELFEGPVELLLYLARRNELDIIDVPIGRLTDDFLGYVRAANRLNLEAAADFLVMAGVLLRLKMRKLLPVDKDEDLDTPTVTLEQILDEFRKYQEAARVLSGKEAERRRFFPRQASPPRARLTDAGDLSALTAAFQRILSRIKPEPIVAVAPRRIRFETKLAELRRLVRSKGSVDFEEALSADTVTEVIVIFIAVLELVRLGEISVCQDRQFGAITLELRTEPGRSGPGPAAASPG
ncbi:MAG: segregation/condensation protein A [candidate division WOR-3 bacterium]|nr:MAG: segregation/condensation protein A [candidate division WOR-3 bacterium]